MENDPLREMESKHKILIHYYGDVVRKLFVLAALIMIVTLPFLEDLLPVPLFVSVIVILGIGIAAGLMNPRQMGIAVFELVVSVVALMVFEYYAVQAFVTNIGELAFWTNQALAVIFFFALYYSSKTVRGMTLRR